MSECLCNINRIHKDELVKVLDWIDEMKPNKHLMSNLMLKMK